MYDTANTKQAKEMESAKNNPNRMEAPTKGLMSKFGKIWQNFGIHESGLRCEAKVQAESDWLLLWAIQGFVHGDDNFYEISPQ